MARPRGQGGSTLLESILTILVVSSIILALAAALLTTTVVAGKVNDGQRLSLAMTTFTEALREMPYQPSTALCTPAGDRAAYLAAYNALPVAQRRATATMTVEIIDIKYWKLDYSAVTVPGFDQWSGTCSEGSGAAKLRVRLTLPGGVPGEGGSATAEVVKRQPSRQRTP